MKETLPTVLDLRKTKDKETQYLHFIYTYSRVHVSFGLDIFSSTFIYLTFARNFFSLKTRKLCYSGYSTFGQLSTFYGLKLNILKCDIDGTHMLEDAIIKCTDL